jgi:hypothetical protein
MANIDPAARTAMSRRQGARREAIACTVPPVS